MSRRSARAIVAGDRVAVEIAEPRALAHVAATDALEAHADRAQQRARAIVAVEVLGERGLGASMEEVARRAGVSRQTIYNHYGSKAELIRALVDRRVAYITAPLEMPGAD